MSQYQVITVDYSINRYQQYTGTLDLSNIHEYSSIASIILALREYLIRSSQDSTDIHKNHLYLMNNYEFMYDRLMYG